MTPDGPFDFELDVHTPALEELPRRLDGVIKSQLQNAATRIAERIARCRKQQSEGGDE